MRIIAVNAVALVILAIGFLYLGQYQNSIIEAKLETFKAEISILATAAAQSTLQDNEQNSLNAEKAQDFTRNLGRVMDSRIRIFDQNGSVIADSDNFGEGGNGSRASQPKAQKDGLYTVEVLKKMIQTILAFLPEKRPLPRYPSNSGIQAEDHPDVPEAMLGQISVSAWSNDGERVFLSTAAPVQKAGAIYGAVLLTRTAPDIEEALLQVLYDILRVFGITLVITVVLSIYLSGLIANPLRKLMLAAEEVRRGQSRETNIPDLSHRHDEIGELSVVLREMTQALWTRMDDIERFAADVAHELKNPLTSLKSAVETLTIVNNKEDRKKLVQIIMHDITRLDRLISDISSASRLDSELSRESFQEIDLRDTLTNLLDLYRNPLKREEKAETDPKQIKVNGTILALDFDEKDSLITLGIKTRLEQVLQNLVANALSFSEKDSTISISAATKLNTIVITVSDEGPGIPNNKLEQIFERFYSERPEHEDYGRHSGLGLSICKQIIDAHRGRIFAENRYNHNGEIIGAKFTIILKSK